MLAAGPISVSVDDAVVLITFVGEATDAEYDDYLSALLSVLQHRGPRVGKCVLVNDASAGFRGTPTQHQRQTDWRKRHQELYLRTVAAVGYVLADAFALSVMASILRMNPSPVPFSLHDNVEAAVAWARGVTSRRTV